MRHFFLSLAAASAALLCGIGTAHAVPAKPGLIQVTQSDGTQLTVRLVGDERRHYMLSPEGYTLTGGPAAISITPNCRLRGNWSRQKSRPAR